MAAWQGSLIIRAGEWSSGPCAWLTACHQLARDHERHPEVSEAIIRWVAIAGMPRRIPAATPAQRQARQIIAWP